MIIITYYYAIIITHQVRQAVNMYDVRFHLEEDQVLQR